MFLTRFAHQSCALRLLDCVHFMYSIGNIRASECVQRTLVLMLISLVKPLRAPVSNFRLVDPLETPWLLSVTASFHHLARLTHKCTIKNRHGEPFFAHGFSAPNLYNQRNKSLQVRPNLYTPFGKEGGVDYSTKGGRSRWVSEISDKLPRCKLFVRVKNRFRSRFHWNLLSL